VTTIVGKPSATDQPTRPTQLFILSESINRVPALNGWSNGGNVTSAGCQVTLCDPMWHVSSRSSEAFANCYTCLLTYGSEREEQKGKRWESGRRQGTVVQWKEG